jgi:hypothetical protein
MSKGDHARAKARYPRYLLASGRREEVAAITARYEAVAHELDED